MRTPLATTSFTTACWAMVQGPEPPRLMLMICAGWVLSGTPGTCSPADQRIASMMSESWPPHFPSARTGRILPCQVMPVIPTALFAMAPRIPTTRVPCQELFSTVQPANGLVVSVVSACVTQSPGSEASASRGSPSLAMFTSVMKS